MQRQSLYLPRLDWEITVFYDSDASNAEEILHALDLAHCDDETYFTAKQNLESNQPDTGLTFTNGGQRESIIVLSHTTSKAEFANTWMHEVIHCATHIATANGIDLRGETIAYIGGDLAMEMQPQAARLMCPTCE